MIVGEPMVFEEALEMAAQKRVLPTSLTSRQISKLSSELKRRSVFSARVTMADHLEKLGVLVAKIAGGLTEDGVVAGTQTGTDRMVSITEAKAQLKEHLDAIGYRPDLGDEGTIQDLSSDKRLALQVETNVLDTLGYGRAQASQDEVALDVNPAWELVRMNNPKVPRDWEARWMEARRVGGEEGTTDAYETGRMVALKNHPIWEALGNTQLFDDALGNPWPPFAFRSGMDVIDVPREEAIELGLLGETTLIPAVDYELNAGVEVATERWNDELAAQVASGGVVIRDGILTPA